ncbi:hypothetical protein HOK021_38810 [Streptomyces hygroscopicus]|nr:hypothetical protein HOK021_38810 [Streptomyces hygroscopicus]
MVPVDVSGLSPSSDSDLGMIGSGAMEAPHMGMDSRGSALQPAHRSEWTPTLCEHRPSDQQDNDCEVANFCMYVVVYTLRDSRKS